LAKYGIPWMGSKQSIANKILTILPKADNFYDLFGGGFSISHCALLSKKYKQIYFNEIQDGICDLIKDAIAGKYSYKVFKPPFISREEFFKKKDTDAYVRSVWSFGNNGKGYLFGKDIEPVKKSLHQAVIFAEFDEFAKKFFGFSRWQTEDLRKRRLISRRIAGEKFRSGELQQLERLQRLQQLELTQKDYREIKTKDNSIVYLDPPYIGTAKYQHAFKHDEFYDYVRTSKHPVYFSEYQAPKEFKCIASIGKNSLLCAQDNRTRKLEKIFANKLGLDFYQQTRIKNDPK